MRHVRSKPLRQRIQDNVEVDENGCWNWQGAIVEGRGVMQVRVHKLAYELFVGDCPQGFVLDHEKCDNPVCCNPAHLRPKTQKENMERSVQATKMFCAKGHAYDEENTYVYTDKRGYVHRLCRACRREANHRRQFARAKKRGGPGYT